MSRQSPREIPRIEDRPSFEKQSLHLLDLQTTQAELLTESRVSLNALAQVYKKLSNAGQICVLNTNSPLVRVTVAQTQFREPYGPFVRRPSVRFIQYRPITKGYLPPRVYDVPVASVTRDEVTLEEGFSESNVALVENQLDILNLAEKNGILPDLSFDRASIINTEAARQQSVTPTTRDV